MFIRNKSNNDVFEIDDLQEEELIFQVKNGEVMSAFGDVVTMDDINEATDTSGDLEVDNETFNTIKQELEID